MKRTAIIIILLSAVLLPGLRPYTWTDFTLTIHITNSSDQAKRLFLEKGRILEIAQVNADYFQSVIITEGNGWIEIPPRSSIQKVIKGICLQKGLKFPPEGARIMLTPFMGNTEYVMVENDQEEVHKIALMPQDNIQMIIAKGYSDSNKDGREQDREEAFQSAVENASRESGLTFSSETILENLKLIQTKQRVTVKEKAIRLNSIVHEEYDERTGEYLFIGEFEVRSKPSRPEIK
ncbi:hypothetical protein ACFL6L_04665 [candidate division KSB1 bacterium]